MLVFRKASEDDIEKIEIIYDDIHSCEEKGLSAFVPCKDDKPKNAEIPPFKAGSDYSLSASHRRFELLMV